MKNSRIGDFGMTRDVTSNGLYTQTRNKDGMPLRWMAPESLNEKIFSEDTDIWSYGMVCMEIVTYGDLPYGDIPDSQVGILVQNGFPPRFPLNCDDDFKNIMNLCWREDPKKERITFKGIVEILLPLITHLPKFKEVSFYHNPIKTEKN